MCVQCMYRSFLFIANCCRLWISTKISGNLETCYGYSPEDHHDDNCLFTRVKRKRWLYLHWKNAARSPLALGIRHIHSNLQFDYQFYHHILFSCAGLGGSDARPTGDQEVVGSTAAVSFVEIDLGISSTVTLPCFWRNNEHNTCKPLRRQSPSTKSAVT